MGDDDGIAAGAECGLTFPETLRVAPAVAELQRVDDRLRQLDPGMDTITEDNLEAQLGADPQVVTAIAADMEIGFELATKQHLLAARALRPQIVRYRLLGDDRPNLRQDEVGQPIHRRPVVTAVRFRVFLQLYEGAEDTTFGDPWLYHAHNKQPISLNRTGVACSRAGDALSSRPHSPPPRPRGQHPLPQGKAGEG